MTEKRLVTLGGRTYPVGDFTIGHIKKIAPLLTQADGKFVGAMETAAQADATATIVWTGLLSGGYTGKYEEFLDLRGVTKDELSAAQLEIGRIIGAYKRPDAGDDDKTGEG